MIKFIFRTVRSVAVPSLGRLITECKVREVRDKARLTLETIAKDPQGVPLPLALPLVSTFAFIAPNCPQNYIEDGKILSNFAFCVFNLCCIKLKWFIFLQL